MPNRIHAATLLAALCFASAMSAAPGITAVDGAIGKNLQAFANIRLTEPAPEHGVLLTLTSGDPSRLLLSLSPETAGTNSIQLKMGPRWVESNDFWLQALDDKGTVTYTVSAPGLTSVKGTITFAPSGILIAGPFRSPTFPTTSGADPSRIVIYSAQLDSAGKFVANQTLAGGLNVDVEVTSSDPQVGKIVSSPVRISGGQNETSAGFKPAKAGESVLAVNVPAGFAKPADLSSVKAIVMVPGLGLSEELIVGKNLQVKGLLSLGQAAPAGGLTVTISSGDPSKMLVSLAADQVGSKSISVTIPEGTVQGIYYLQALSDTGIVQYSASAAGYRTRTEPVQLTPAGMVITYLPYGPPDRAEVFRPHEEHPKLGFFTNLAPGRASTRVAVWMVQLDPVTRRGADVTVQHLRAGLTAKVPLLNSDPAVGVVDSEVIISAGDSHGIAEFKPLKSGKTVLSVKPLPGFAEPSNSTTLPATVQE